MHRTPGRTEELLAALDRGEALPSYWYTDATVTENERDRIFRRTWQYVGPIQLLQNAGDYITAYVGEIPVVVVRNSTGLSGFVNVCRHRRHEVMQGCGNSPIMQCPYHAWTYDLNGTLKAAPRADKEIDFHCEDYPLLPMRIDTLGPWVFANADLGGPSLAACFGEVLELISECGINPNDLKLWNRESWQASANWKTMLENYLECYHCAVAHPGFACAIDVDQESYRLSTHEWFSSQIGHVRQSALEGKSRVKTYDTKGAIKQAQYHFLWPNFTININPGHPNLSVDVWLPDGPNKAKGFTEQYFGADVDEDWASNLIKFNQQVGLEDDSLTNSVQRGLIGGVPESGRFLSNSEILCIHFLKNVVRAMADD